MGGIHNQHVHACSNQCLDPLVGIGTGPHRGTHPKPPVAVLAGQGKTLCLVEVLDRDHPTQAKVVVYHQDFLYAMLVQQLLYFF